MIKLLPNSLLEVDLQQSFRTSLLLLQLLYKSTSADGSKTYENLNVKQITFSAYPSIQHKWKADDQPETQVNVDDYDLPF